MRILAIDSDGIGLDFVIRCQDAGHDVKWFVRKDAKDANEELGQGLSDKVDEWESWMKWADLIWITSNDKYIYQLERYRNNGFPIFGPNLASTDLEVKREVGQEFMKKHGIDILPYKIFTNYDEAEKFVRKNPIQWVSKPLGDNPDKGLSYVSKHPADMVFMLQRWKKLGKNMGQLMLQEFKKGIEIGVSGWLGKSGWVGPFNENFEFKKLMNDDLGVNTGEQGTVMKYVRKSKLAREVLEPLTDSLIEMGHLGDIDINCILDEDGKIWPLEFTCRPGWPAWWIMQHAHEGDPAEWMLDLLDGRDTLKTNHDVAIGIVISQPDYPYSHFTKREVTGIPVYGMDVIRDHIHPVYMMKDKAPIMEGDTIIEKEMLVTAGDYILVVTDSGKTVGEAKKNVYSKVKKLEIPNSIGYRTDIGDRLKKQLPELHFHGYATEFQY